MTQPILQSTRSATSPRVTTAATAIDPAPKRDVPRATVPLDAFKEPASTRTSLQAAVRATDDELRTVSGAADALAVDLNRRIMASDVDQLVRLARLVEDIPGFKDTAYRVQDAHSELGKWKKYRVDEQREVAESPDGERITLFWFNAQLGGAQQLLDGVSGPLRQMIACNEEARVRAEPELTGRSQSGGPYETVLAQKRALLVTRAQLLAKLDE